MRFLLEQCHSLHVTSIQATLGSFGEVCPFYINTHHGALILFMKTKANMLRPVAPSGCLAASRCQFQTTHSLRNLFGLSAVNARDKFPGQRCRCHGQLPLLQ